MVELYECKVKLLLICPYYTARKVGTHIIYADLYLQASLCTSEKENFLKKKQEQARGRFEVPAASAEGEGS